MESDTMTRLNNWTCGVDALTPMEYVKVCDACSSIEDECLIKFTISTGLRRDDIPKVLWANVDLERGTVTYTEKKKFNRIRTIHIGQKLIQLLTKYKKTCSKEQKVVFAFGGRTAYNKLQRLCDIAGIRRRPFHALRSTCVKRCQANGWTPEQVCELTGDTWRTIQRHYATPSISEMSDVANLKEVV
jgi:integrase